MKVMSKVLVSSDKYNGKYVAVKSANDNTVVGSGDTPEQALKKAAKAGTKKPFLFYVPDEASVHIYYVGKKLFF